MNIARIAKKTAKTLLNPKFLKKIAIPELLSGVAFSAIVIVGSAFAHGDEYEETQEMIPTDILDDPETAADTDADDVDFTEMDDEA